MTITRRQVLATGSAGLGAGLLPTLVRAQAATATLAFGPSTAVYALGMIAEAKGFFKLENLDFKLVIGNAGDTVSLSDLHNRFNTSIPPIKNAIFASLVGSGYYARRPDSVRSNYIVGGVITAMLLIWGGSFLADPFGRVICEASHNKEEILLGEIDLKKLENVRPGSQKARGVETSRRSLIRRL